MSRFLDKLQFEVEPTRKTAVKLTARLRYLDEKDRLFTVPQGFVCDLASVPRWLRSLATPWNLSARAGVLHDCLYRWGPEVWKVWRPESDKMYRRALSDDRVSWWRATIHLLSVRVGGLGAWRHYRAMKRSEKGIKPGPYRDP